MLYTDYLKCKRDYQELGHVFLLTRKHACLYYKPGKGKTYPTIDALRDVADSYGGKAKVLILSTADAIKNMWNDEIVPQNILPENTVLMTFNAAVIDKTKAQLLKVRWDIVIVDECHKIKSHSTQISKLVYLLTKKCAYAWGLSGTPRGNSDVDIYCQFHNLNISEWGTIPYTHFVNTCCDVENKFFGGRMIVQPTGISEKYRAGWERNVAMYSQRIDYEEADDMPDLNADVVELPYVPTPEYLQAEVGVIAVSNYESTMTKLAAIQKLHQAVNGFLYLRDDEESERFVHKIERNKKLDWLIENITTEPTVVVYRFQADVFEIQKLLTDNKISFTSDVPTFKKGNIRVLLLQCSRGESFNLQMCHRIIFYTMDYSYIKYNQMMHRVWRMGQTESVTITILTFKDTIETKIWHAVKNKERLAQLFMNIKGV